MDLVKDYLLQLTNIYFIRTNYTQPGLNGSFSKWQSWFKIYFTKNVFYQQQGTIHQNVFSTSCKFYFSGSLVIDSLTLVLSTYVFLTSGITYGAVFVFCFFQNFRFHFSALVNPLTPMCASTGFLLTISIKYQPDKWWE